MQYYYLIAGLAEYSFDTHLAGDGKLDVPQVKRQIMADLSDGDRRGVELLYTYYDIENILGYIRGTKLPFNALGNLSPEQVAFLVDGNALPDGETLPEDLAIFEQGLVLPSSIRLIVDRFKGRNPGELETEDFEPVSAQDLERELFGSFYKTCGSDDDNWGGISGRILKNNVPEYLRHWAEIDRMIRNITAAYKARALGLSVELVEGMIVDSTELRETLLTSQAADFGLKGEFVYMEALLSVLETEDFVERERKMDALRWDIADDLAEHDYFGIGRIMDYLIHLNILHRWVALDAASGRENFRTLVTGLTDADTIAQSVEGRL